MEDGAERSEGSMHEARPEQPQIKLFGTEWYHGWVRFKDILPYIYIDIHLLLLYQVTPLLYCCATSQCHRGWVDRFVCVTAVLP